MMTARKMIEGTSGSYWHDGLLDRIQMQLFSTNGTTREAKRNPGTGTFVSDGKSSFSVL
jgi:hypothetical protein